MCSHQKQAELLLACLLLLRDELLPIVLLLLLERHILLLAGELDENSDNADRICSGSFDNAGRRPHRWQGRCGCQERETCQRVGYIWRVRSMLRILIQSSA